MIKVLFESNLTISVFIVSDHSLLDSEIYSCFCSYSCYNCCTSYNSGFSASSLVDFSVVDRFFFYYQSYPFWVGDFCIDYSEDLEEVDRYEMRVEVHG